MVRERQNDQGPGDAVISIIAPGMTVIGNCESDGTIRVEGSVSGSIKAGKAVVVGKKGLVSGEVFTQDAVISGRVEGSLVAASRLELKSTARIEGEVKTRRMQLEEGAVLNGTVEMGAEATKGTQPKEGASTLGRQPSSTKPSPEGTAT